MRDAPNLVLAEAGTGIGKTLGYLAPASLWAERAGGAVWISTFTKALQRQLAQETARLYPDPAERRAQVVTRKGRENYLCLLNLEDALQGGFAGRAAVLAQLVARWAAYTRRRRHGRRRPARLAADAVPPQRPAALTDRRGECVYAGCPHYRKCFIERAARASARGRHRHRQPRAGDGQRRARPRDRRRGRRATSSTRATTSTTPPTRCSASR